MVDPRTLAALAALAGLCSACLGHPPLTAAGIEAPVLLGPVRRLGGGAEVAHRQLAASISMTALEQIVIVPIGHGYVSQHENLKSPEQALAGLSANAGGELAIEALRCKAFMSVFVRSTHCTAEAGVQGALSAEPREE